MSGARALRPAAEAALRTRIGSISGVHVASIETLPLTGGRHAVLMEVAGWSPSLNAATATWRFDVDPDQDAETQATRAIADCAETIVAQRRGAAAGLELGTAAPFGIAGVDDPADNTAVGHVLVDRGLARLFDETCDGLLAEARDAVWALHADRAWNGLDREWREDVTSDAGVIHGTMRLDGRLLTRDVTIGRGVSFDGRRVTCRRALPGTALAAAVGSTLGRLVEVPGHLAGRTIVAARATGDDDPFEGLVLEVEVDAATVDELLAEGERA